MLWFQYNLKLEQSQFIVGRGFLTPPLLYEHPPILATPTPLFQIFSNPRPPLLPISTLTALFTALFFLSYCLMGDRATFDRVFQVVLRGREESPQWEGGNGKFCCGKIFYRVGGKLTGSDFDDFNLFQSSKQNSVNIEYRLKSKLA